MRRNATENQKSSSRRGYEKIVLAISLVCSAFVMIFGVLQVTGKMANGMDYAQPLLGVVMLCQCILQWRKNRKLALFSLAVSIFVFVVAGLIFASR